MSVRPSIVRGDRIHRIRTGRGALVIIDCDRCAIRGVGCPDCVVSVLLDAPATIELTDPELTALGALADAGLVPHLKLVPLDRPTDIKDKPVDTRTAVKLSAERSSEYVGRHRRQVS
jgi:hypothetical protein